jgi:hypothetical protein
MSNGKLTKESSEKFIELMVEQAPAMAAMHVVIFRWPFPWLKPWRWPAWLVWRWHRGWKKDRFLVPTFGPKDKP